MSVTIPFVQWSNHFSDCVIKSCQFDLAVSGKEIEEDSKHFYASTPTLRVVAACKLRIGAWW